MRFNLAFKGLTQRRIVISYRRFGTTYRSHPQGTSGIDLRKILTIYQKTRHNTSEDANLQDSVLHTTENFKEHKGCKYKIDLLYLSF